jgi:hypothetical protein
MWIFSEEGVSPSLANYMTMALDPNVGHLVSFMREEIPDYGKVTACIAFDLQTHLHTRNKNRCHHFWIMFFVVTVQL